MKPFIVPFTVIVDTREQYPYTFAKIPADKGEGGGTLTVPTERGTLETGDYSIKGLEQIIAIESKSKEDLFGSLGSGRGRFVRELERSEFTLNMHIVCEAELSAIRHHAPAIYKAVGKNCHQVSDCVDADDIRESIGISCRAGKWLKSGLSACCWHVGGKYTNLHRI